MEFELIKSDNKIYICPSLKFEADDELSSAIDKRNKAKIALDDRKYIRMTISFVIAINFLLRLIILLSTEIMGVKILFTVMSVIVNILLLGFIIFKLNSRIKALEDEYAKLQSECDNVVELFLQEKVKNVKEDYVVLE